MTILSNYHFHGSPIEAGDGVELVVKAMNLRPLAVGLEPVDHHGLHKHGGELKGTEQIIKGYKSEKMSR